MSRLDSMIKRLIAQRDLLNQAMEMVTDVPGPVLELGLGNGRTYDHLKEVAADRDIFVFERAVGASPKSTPEADFLILGEIRENLPFAKARTGPTAAMIHADLSNGDPTADLARSAWLSPMIAGYARSGTVVVCGHALDLPDFEELPLPDSVLKGRYYLYRKP